MKALMVLNRYIWQYKKLLLLGVLTVIISNIFGVYPPQVVRASIDLVGDLIRINKLHQGFTVQTGTGQMIAAVLLVFGGLVVVLALLRGLFLFFTRQTLIVMSRKVEYDLRNDLYRHYQELSLSFYRRNKTGDLMARISEDIGRVRMYLGPGIMYTTNTVTLMLVVLATMLMVNPTLTFYTILPLPLLSFAVWFVESVILRRSDRLQKQLSALTEYTQEVYSGIRVAKAYGREQEFGEKFAQASNEYKRRAMGLVRVDTVFFPVVFLLIGISTTLAVWIGAEKVMGGTLSIGTIAEFVIYVNMLAWPIISIGWVTTLIQRAAASQQRLNEFMDEQSEVDFVDAPHQVEKADLLFEDVHFRYPETGIAALNGVSFTLRAGMKLGIMGPTGSGKSTLCNLIPRLFDVDSGRILLDGRELKQYGKAPLRSSIGYAPQDVFLFSETIRENIAFGLPGATLEQVEKAAQDAGIYDNIMDFPDGFETVVGERGVTLSGGQKQRTAMARAWIRLPKLLILDDSLSAVDTRTEELILSNLRRARTENPNMSIIMVSHRISTIQDADLILVMEDGRITEQGTHAELIQHGGYYETIYRKQLLEKEKAAETPGEAHS